MGLKVHPLEAHLLARLPAGWPQARGHKLRPARLYGDEASYRAWLTPLRDAGEAETVVYHSRPGALGGARWFAPGVPMVYLGEQAGHWLRHAYRLPVAAALEAADLGLITYVPGPQHRR